MRAAIDAGTLRPGERLPSVREARQSRQLSPSTVFAAYAKANDWGPYDYHRDFNLTFPAQVMADVSHTLGARGWFGFPQTRFCVRGTWRSLDRDSPRYCPDQVEDAFGVLECDPEASGKPEDPGSRRVI